MTTSFVTHSFTRCAVENDEIWVLHMYYNLCLSVLPYVALGLVVSVYFFFFFCVKSLFYPWKHGAEKIKCSVSKRMFFL